MCATGDDVTIFDDQDKIGVAHGGNALSHRDDRHTVTIHYRVERLLQVGFRRGIDRAHRVIEQQDAWAH